MKSSVRRIEIFYLDGGKIGRAGNYFLQKTLVQHFDSELHALIKCINAALR